MSVPASGSPIFIGGMFKSGTSLLRAMIGNHSLVASGLETYWFDLDWSDLASDRASDRLRIIGEFYELDAAGMSDLVAGSDSAEAFLTALMEYWADKNGKPGWAEKTPGNVRHIDRIRKYWPSARIIHIIRDPRDIFASLKEAGKWDTASEFMDRWTDTFADVERFRAAGILADDRYLEIRYEDLVTAPEPVMRQVCGFCALPFEKQVATFAGQDKDFETVRQATGRSSTTLARLREPMTNSRVGIWRSVLSDDDTRELEMIAEKAGLGEAYRRAFG